jgi:hypothetical protein
MLRCDGLANGNRPRNRQALTKDNHATRPNKSYFGFHRGLFQVSTGDDQVPDVLKLGNIPGRRFPGCRVLDRDAGDRDAREWDRHFAVEGLEMLDVDL